MLPKTGHQGRGGNVSFGHHLGGRSMAECGWKAVVLLGAAGLVQQVPTAPFSATTTQSVLGLSVTHSQRNACSGN